MNRNYPIIIAFVAVYVCMPGLSWAQDEVNEGDVGTEENNQEAPEGETEADENDTATEADDVEPSEDTSEDGVAEVTEEATGTELSGSEDGESPIDDTFDENDEPLELEEKKPINLDMSALGEIDPEKELNQDSALSENDAQNEVLEEWTERAMDLLEIHGYFRVRPELYDDFNIRNDDAIYLRSTVGAYNISTDPEGYMGEDCSGASATQADCMNSTRAGANMRFRLEPTINVSEEVWIKSQIDFLDNVMMGSTPLYYQNYMSPHDDGTTSVSTRSVQGWSMAPPDSSQMAVVRRAWGEVMTPFGQLRFGRMGDHWGLGMLHNAGNGLNQDFGDSVDRIMFASKINDWLIAPAFDFPNEGVAGVDASGRPFDVAQLDDAYQLSAIVGYKHDLEEQNAILKRGDWVINSGVYFTYRWQVLSYETDAADTGDEEGMLHFYKRDMWAVTPDFWFQFLVDTFRLEFEFALIYGELGNSEQTLSEFDNAELLKLIQWGGVIQAKYGLLSDHLKLGLEFGFASGDEDIEGLRTPGSYDQLNNPESSVFSAFSFNPAYNTDLILYHHILGSVNQSYYFKFWLDFAFLHNAMGRQMNLRLDALFSRAVFGLSTINGTDTHTGSQNLGIEIDLQALYRTEDNFFAGLQYGALFPLAAFKGEPMWEGDGTSPFINDTDLAVPQTLQVILGIVF